LCEAFLGGGGFGRGIAVTGGAGETRVGRTPAASCSLALLTDPFLSGSIPPGRGPGRGPGPELGEGVELIDSWSMLSEIVQVIIQIL